MLYSCTYMATVDVEGLIIWAGYYGELSRDMDSHYTVAVVHQADNTFSESEIKDR